MMFLYFIVFLWLFYLTYIRLKDKFDIETDKQRLYNEIDKVNENIENNKKETEDEIDIEVEIDNVNEDIKNINESLLSDKITSAKIQVSYILNVPSLLVYFFKNSFENEEKAYIFYKNFLQEAQELGESPDIYKNYMEEISFTKNIDFLSGNIINWNWFYKNPTDSICFPFFSFLDIKNIDLKQKVKKLYIENLDYQQNNLHNFNGLSPNENLFVCRNLKINCFGFDFYSNTYDPFEHWINNETIFQLPIKDLIYDLKEFENNNLSEEKFNEQLNYYKEKYKPIKINRHNEHIIIASTFLSAVLSVKYNYPNLYYELT